ncbi:hypothetical protein ASE99_12015 [Serratia sp. Leaf51]|nr:hypothetical protein ASE99_12015 [Serratia sp. Leaf51]
MTMRFLKRFLLWQFKFLCSIFAPGLLILLFAIGFFDFFPDGPIWPVGVFAILVIFIFVRYVKW